MYSILTWTPQVPIQRGHWRLGVPSLEWDWWRSHCCYPERCQSAVPGGRKPEVRCPWVPAGFADLTGPSGREATWQCPAPTREIHLISFESYWYCWTFVISCLIHIEYVVVCCLFILYALLKWCILKFKLSSAANTNTVIKHNHTVYFEVHRHVGKHKYVPVMNCPYTPP